MERHLLNFYKQQLIHIIKSPNKLKDFIILLDLSLLKAEDEKLFLDLTTKNYEKIAAKWCQAIIIVQKQLKDTDPAVLGSVKINITIKLCKHPNIIENFKLLPDVFLFKLVAFKATIVKKHQSKQRIITKKFMCIGCKKNSIVEADKYYGYGFHCGRCKEQITLPEDGQLSISVCNREILPCKYTDKKFIKSITTQVYEVTVPHLEKHKNYGDKTYLIDVEGELMNSFEVGQSVNIIGIVKTRNTQPKKRLSKFGIYAINIEPQQDLYVTKNLIDGNFQYRLLTAWMHDMQQNENSEIEARNEMVENLFPSYVGASAVKLAILLTICSGCGSSENNENQKEVDKRDVFHLMLAGQRGAGKRTLLRLAADLSPKSNEVMSFGLTVNSLTARGFKLKKSGDNNIEAGVLVRANGGISCFYEFDSMKKKYRKILHEIMETQRIKMTTSKLKANIKLNASIVAAQRIKKIRKSKTSEITSKMFKIEESLLNRFDLIFVMREPYDDKFYTEEMFEQILSEAGGEDTRLSSNWPIDRIKAHLACAKTYSTVKLTKDVEQILIKYFQFCSRHCHIPKWRTSSRMFEGLKRITLSHARLMLRTETKILDAITTIMLSEMSYPLGFLIQKHNLQLNDNLRVFDNDYVFEVLDKLKLSSYTEKYLDESQNCLNITQQIEAMISKHENEENLKSDYSIDTTQKIPNLRSMETQLIESFTKNKSSTTKPKKRKSNLEPQAPAKKAKKVKNNPSISSFLQPTTTKNEMLKNVSNEAIFANLQMLSGILGPNSKNSTPPSSLKASEEEIEKQDETEKQTIEQQESVNQKENEATSEEIKFKNVVDDELKALQDLAMDIFDD